MGVEITELEACGTTSNSLPDSLTATCIAYESSASVSVLVAY